MADDAPTIEVRGVFRAEEIDGYGIGDLNALPLGEVLMIRGWAIGTKAAAMHVEIRSDDDEVEALVPVRLSRPDVTLAVGDGMPGAETPGFVLELEPQGSGETKFVLRVAFADGMSATLGTIAVRVTSMGEIGTARWVRRDVPGEREKVVVGKAGWLFLRLDTNDVIGQHTGRVRLDDSQRSQWRLVLERRVAEMERVGATWLCVVIPDKEAVYAEFLPDEIAPVGRRTVHEFLDIAEEVGAPVIYALDALQEAKDRGPLFVQTDTHWNQRGAFVAYRMICAALGARGVEVRPLEEPDVLWSEEIVQGDLGAKLYPEAASSPIVRATLARHYSDLLFDNRVLNHGRVLIYEQDRPDLPVCVVFGESFAKNLLIFLQASFRRLVFVHTSMVVPEVLEMERPDVVLSVPVERFLLKVPDDTDGFAKLAATAHEKGGELPWDPAERG
jgi:SGNH hydrolase-like domain, acetyltransferase AlgX